MTRKKQLDRSRKWAKRKGSQESPAPRDSSLARILDELQTAAFKGTIDRGQAAFLKDLLHQSPILAAAHCGRNEAVECLLRAGRDPNTTSKDGTTPLMLAVAQGHVDVVTRLLEEGADAWIISKDGKSALQLAVQNMNPILFNFIWNHLEKADRAALLKSSKCLLHLASELGWDFCVAFLLKFPEADAEQKGKDGKTALMAAAAEGRDNVVMRLLNFGAQILREDQCGATAACWAVARRHMSTAKTIFLRMTSAEKETYVQKRLSLLISPTTSGRDTRTFYRDMLFRVLVAVRLFMENGVRLLLSHSVFEALISCCRRHMQDASILNPILHICACFLHDKAAFSKYIQHDMAEAFIDSSAPNFILEVLSTHAPNSQTCSTALLPILPVIELEAGRLWVKQHLKALIPPFREFSPKKDMDFFWTEGEKIKTCVMWERFKERFAQFYFDEFGVLLEIVEPIIPEEAKGTLSRKRAPVIGTNKSPPTKKKTSNKRSPRQQLQVSFRDTFRMSKRERVGIATKNADLATFDIVPTAPPSTPSAAGQLRGYANAVKNNLPKREALLEGPCNAQASNFQEVKNSKEPCNKNLLNDLVLDKMTETKPTTAGSRPVQSRSFPLRRSNSAPSLKNSMYSVSAFNPFHSKKIEPLSRAIETLSSSWNATMGDTADNPRFVSQCGADAGKADRCRETKLPCQLLHALQESVLRDILKTEQMKSLNKEETAMSLAEAMLKAMNKVAKVDAASEEARHSNVVAEVRRVDSVDTIECSSWWKMTDKLDIGETPVLSASWTSENQRWKQGYQELANSPEGTLVHVKGIFYKDTKRLSLMRGKYSILGGKMEVFLAMTKSGMELLLKKIELQSDIPKALNRISSFQKLNITHRNLIFPHVTCLCSQQTQACYIVWPPQERNLSEHVALLKEIKYPLIEWGRTAATQILDGLTFLHIRSQPILHGRLKPSNVLVSSKGHILLTDFGLQEIAPDIPFGFVTRDHQEDTLTQAGGQGNLYTPSPKIWPKHVIPLRRICRWLVW
ncbi:uncharacterized protein LOC135397971 isoform X2 [Ornithodoros turicata]|uniref:uncharacterized protein LOC135397971 isoform X2 n=1 Tax=Ornithodoros turicata TaxID=34597 RepID=UPI0031397298